MNKLNPHLGALLHYTGNIFRSNTNYAKINWLRHVRKALVRLETHNRLFDSGVDGVYFALIAQPLILLHILITPSCPSRSRVFAFYRYTNHCNAFGLEKSLQSMFSHLSVGLLLESIALRRY